MRRTINLACTAKQVPLDSCYASVQGPQICQKAGAAPLVSRLFRRAVFHRTACSKCGRSYFQRRRSMPDMTELQVFDRFAQIVAHSLSIDVSQVTADTYLSDLGAESLDLIEITMESETQFHIFLPDKSILETAVEVFGPGILEKDIGR